MGTNELRKQFKGFKGFRREVTEALGGPLPKTLPAWKKLTYWTAEDLELLYDLLVIAQNKTFAGRKLQQLFMVYGLGIEGMNVLEFYALFTRLGIMKD